MFYIYYFATTLAETEADGKTAIHRQRERKKERDVLKEKKTHRGIESVIIEVKIRYALLRLLGMLVAIVDV